MRFLPAVSDGRPVFESNYSIVGFSRNLCLAFSFKAALVVVATAGLLDIRRYVVSSWERVAAITRLYKRQLHITVFTERVGQGDTWHWLVWNRAPISQLGKCSMNQCSKMRERLNTELLRHSIDTWEWCHHAEGVTTPIHNPLSLSHAHTSQQTCCGGKCVTQREMWLDRWPWLTG